MKALFPKQTNFAVSNFLTKAERLQERYLKYWLNLLLCNSIASIAVLEQTKPAIFCLQNFCETFWNPKQLFCFSTTTKPHLLRVLHVVTHVKFSFCATILFKVWEGWVSSNNFYEDSKSGIGVKLWVYFFPLKFCIVVQCFKLTFLVGLASTPITGDAL